MRTSVGIDVPLAGDAQGRGGRLRPESPSPGQYLTEKWPVLHAGTVPDTDLATWEFRVFGEVESPVTLSWAEFTALPTSEITIDIHCVTRWSRFDTSFKGVHWSELARS